MKIITKIFSIALVVLYCFGFSNDLPKKVSKKTWMKDHLPNMTGTPYAYEYKDQKKSDKVKNIYSIWKPDEN